MRGMSPPKLRFQISPVMLGHTVNRSQLSYCTALRTACIIFVLRPERDDDPPPPHTHTVRELACLSLLI